MRGGDGAEERAEAVANHCDALRVELGARGHPVHYGFASGDPVGNRHVYIVDGTFVLTGAFERQYGDAARQPAIAVEGDVGFLETIHAGNRPHGGEFVAAVAGWQVQPAGQGLALKRNPCRFDVMIGVLGKTRVTLALGGIQGEIFCAVFIVRPLRGGVQYRGVKKIVARSHQLASVLGGARLDFAAARSGLECRRDIRVFFHAFADAAEIRVGLGSAGRVVSDRARLIPIDAD